MSTNHPETSPWAIPVAQVASRPGQSKDVDADFPAPSGIGDEVVSVREGAAVHVSGTIDSIIDGLVFTAAITAPVTAECTRCLKPLNDDHTIHVTTFFPYAPDARSMRDTANENVEIIAGEDEGGDTYALAGNNTVMDLESLLRDNLTEMLPLQPLCRPDCAGLCPQCGADLNDDPDHHHDVTDIRWSALEALKAQLEQHDGDAADAA